jgi:hypothetical protein
LGAEDTLAASIEPRKREKMKRTPILSHKGRDSFTRKPLKTRGIASEKILIRC